MTEPSKDHGQITFPDATEELVALRQRIGVFAMIEAFNKDWPPPMSRFWARHQDRLARLPKKRRIGFAPGIAGRRAA